MSSRLADRLSAARHSQFVGRTAELELFQSALAAPDLSFCVLYIFGIGGVGKTTLLREFARLCAQLQTPAIYLDARNIEPSPASFLDALRLAMDLAPLASPIQVLMARPDRHVLLIDTYETLAPLDAWLRETFLSELPENTLVVLAGRRPPSPAWLADPGWSTLVRPLPLGNLSPQESRAYLAKRQVSFEQHQAVLDFTHGHPLALSLVAEVIAQRPGLRFQPEAVPDVLKTLLLQFREHVPSRAHRAALEACSVVRVTTEALLAEMLAVPDAHDVFEWLRNLGFIEAGPSGLFPHDLAREALAVDLRWRDRDCYAQLRRRAGTYYIRRLQQAHTSELERLVLDYIFLHRDSPAVGPFFDWQASGTVFSDLARHSDVPELLAIVAQHEGEDSARLAAHWLARQLDRVMVFRGAAARGGSKPALAGFVLMIALHEASAEDLSADPATLAAWRYVQNHAPLRPGEGATYFRFWMARDTYQALSPIQSLVFVHLQRHFVTTSGLGPLFIAHAAIDLYEAVGAYAGIVRIPEADFEVGGRRYGVVGIDARSIPPIEQLQWILERETSAEPLSIPVKPAAASCQLPFLDQQEFAVAVRDALRGYADAVALRSNPLLRSRLVEDLVGVNAGQAEQVAALRSVLQEAAEALQSSPRQAKWYRALYHTYLHPAPSQEKAAEVLDLPRSTFRRYLKAGLTYMVDSLWQWEIRGLEK